MNKKRVELSVHTNMSALDGINDVGNYINEAMRDWMPAIAITDNNSVQAIPAAYNIVNKNGGIKLIYGAELIYKKDNNKFPLTVLAKNKKGLKELYKLISEAHTENFDKVPLIDLKEITCPKENLFLGISIMSEPIYKIVDGAFDAELEEIIKPFDFVMLHPIEYFNSFITDNKINDKSEVIKITNRVLNLCERNEITTVASDDVHFVFSDDGECRKILLNYKGYTSYSEQPNLYLRTTEEMLKEFDFLGKEKAYEIVVENTNSIANKIDDTFAPFDESAEYPNEIEKLKDMTYLEATKRYGNDIPKEIKSRMDWELGVLGRSSKSVMGFLISAAITESATEKGFSICSRGSIASSLVANLIGITTVNPLKAHYYCPSCKKIEFYKEEKCGIDLPDKQCSVCSAKLNKEGFNIPAETFFGLNEERELDIVLNLPVEYRNEAIDNINTMVDGKILRCGKIDCVSPHQSYVMIDKYCKNEKIKYSDIRTVELVNKLESIKNTTKAHPGEIVVIPKDKEIYDYTPVQYPGNNIACGSLITHFENHSLCNNLFKINLIAHNTLSMIIKLEQLTGIASRSIPLDDKETMELINDCDTIGMPEFSEEFAEDIIRNLKPKNFEDLIKIVALSHGSSVPEDIPTRDDVMLSLMTWGIDREYAYKLSERIRKGKGVTCEQYDKLVEKGVSRRFLDSCNEIMYSFPKSHCVEYAQLAFKTAYYKTHYPLDFYCAFLDTYSNVFEPEMLNSGYLAKIDKEIEETAWQDYCEDDYSKQELAKLCVEVFERGYEFVLEKGKSSVTGFVIDNNKIKGCY